MPYVKRQKVRQNNERKVVAWGNARRIIVLLPEAFRDLLTPLFADSSPSDDRKTAVVTAVTALLEHVLRTQVADRIATWKAQEWTLRKAVLFAKGTDAPARALAVATDAGGVSSDPEHVLSRAGRDWQTIYGHEGASEADIAQALRDVHWTPPDPSIASQHEWPRWSGDRVRKSFDTQKRRGAAGLDNWLPAELKHWPIAACDALACLFNAIEDRLVQWPTALLQLRVVLLTKSGSPAAPTALQLRPLSIASAVYRSWARIRARDIAVRVELTQHVPVSAEGFRVAHGAQQATWSQQLLADLAAIDPDIALWASVQIDFSN